MNMNCKVSVIVPIYKVEKFIGRCAESLMQQTLDDVEYIFVNDATPDSSMEILEGVLKKYPGKRPDIGRYPVGLLQNVVCSDCHQQGF